MRRVFNKENQHIQFYKLAKANLLLDIAQFSDNRKALLNEAEQVLKNVDEKICLTDVDADISANELEARRYACDNYYSQRLSKTVFQRLDEEQSGQKSMADAVNAAINYLKK